MLTVLFLMGNFLLAVLFCRVVSYVLQQRSVLATVIIMVFYFIEFYLMLWLHCHPSMMIYMLLVLFGTVMGGDAPKAFIDALDKALGPYRVVLYLLSVFTSLLLIFIYLPITIFLTSPDEIMVHLDFLFTENMNQAMILFYGSAVLYVFLFSPHYKTLVCYVSTSGLMILLLYAYAFPFGYPIMNGLMFEQLPLDMSTLIFRCSIDLVVVPGILFCVYHLMRHRKAAVIQAIVMVNIILMVVAYIKITEKEISYFDDVQANGKVEFPLQYSKRGQNVLLIMLDRLMGGFVEQILTDDPSLSERLSGFTWYPKTVSAGQNSISGLHPLLGGYDYTPWEINQRDGALVDKSTESFSILPYNFTRSGYQVNWINPKGLGFTLLGDCSLIEMEGLNCTHIPSSVTSDMAKLYGVPLKVLAESSYAELMVLLGAMRASPYAYKNVLRNRGPWRPFLKHEAGTTFKEWSELKALPRLSTDTASENNLNILVNILPHEPYFMGRDCLPKANITMFPEAEYKGKGFPSLFAYQHFIAAGCALQLVADYFDWMREHGIYDNTKIVIVLDHGIVGPVEDHSSRAVQGGTVARAFVAYRSALFVKKRNGQGPLSVSEAFVPNASVPEILCKEIGGCVNPYLDNKPIQSFGRDDPFHISFVPWQFIAQRKEKFYVLREYTIRNKDPFVLGNWAESKGSQ